MSEAQQPPRRRRASDDDVPDAGTTDPSHDDESGAPKPPDAPGSEDNEHDIAVTVIRSGGFAGLTRTWVAEPPPTRARFWVMLISECPWDEEPSDANEVDRFVWQIDAVTGAEHRTAELPERDVRGPWRELIDAVREESDIEGGSPR